MEEREIRGTYGEIADHFSALSVEYNRLEITLIDLKQDEAIKKNGLMMYVEVKENYELGEGRGFAHDGKPLPTCTVGFYGAEGPYPIGRPWKPFAISIVVDGHSRIKSESKKTLWPKYFEEIKERVHSLVAGGYILRSFSALKNQKDDFPGTIDAEEKLWGFGRQ